MTSDLVYRTLVPDAPLHRRTDADIRDERFATRRRSDRMLRDRPMLPGLQQPQLVSSYRGSIDRILFSFPDWAVSDPELAAAYRSVIGALRPGTRFVVVHHRSVASDVQGWFAAAGHETDNLLLVGMPDYVSLTDWAEDAYVALSDGADGTSYLMEPWEFKRAGDALIADAVEDASDICASQAPLIFQGGNCLVGGDVWFMGKDYYADTLELLRGDRPPVSIPPQESADRFIRRLFAEYVDATKTLVLIGTRKPIPLREYVGRKEGRRYFLDVAANGVGTFQPIFHIDMFISLVGETDDGRFEVLVGSPRLADRMLGTRSPYALDDVYDAIADSLADAGFVVRRNPLVHRPTIGRSLSLAELKQLSTQPGYDILLDTVKELVAAGARPNTRVRVRDWHHITWNNCLVESSASKGRHVYLPTFGHGTNADLRPIDDEMTRIWEELGFTVHPLGDFNKFAARQGVVHCIKKYLVRGD
jgi:hypothetical protein